MTHAIKQACTTNTADDSGSFQRAQVTNDDKTSTVTVVWPYGFGGSPPVGSFCLMFTANGHEENRHVIATAPDKRMATEEGECYMANLVTGSYVFMRKNGDIEIVAKGNENISVDKDFNLNAAGNVNINGSKINLGQGGQPIARKGDTVEVIIAGVPYQGTITSGSTTNTSV